MSRTTQTHDQPERTNRRGMLRNTAGAAVLGMTALSRNLHAQDPPSAEHTVKNGRIKQSIVYWCFEKHWNMDQAAKVAKDLGCESIELVAPKFFPTLKQYGLTCAIGTVDMSPDPPFVKGFNNPKYRERVLKETTDAIDACAEFGCKNVISFTGMREGIPDDVGADNCVEGFKQIVGHAEKKGVTLCLEMLNSRVSTHPMKGHPGYQGDHTDYCVDIIKRVGSAQPEAALRHLSCPDHGRRRDQPHSPAPRLIAHIHTAGNPGRGELDNKQEINYPPIMEALLEIGYKGHVGQEFIPTRDPLEGLKQAVALCDV